MARSGTGKCWDVGEPFQESVSMTADDEHAMAGSTV
jgi:hypothetical protein